MPAALTSSSTRKMPATHRSRRFIPNVMNLKYLLMQPGWERLTAEQPAFRDRFASGDEHHNSADHRTHCIDITTCTQRCPDGFLKILQVAPSIPKHKRDSIHCGNAAAIA